jgi:hypothetical protein
MRLFCISTILLTSLSATGEASVLHDAIAKAARRGGDLRIAWMGTSITCGMGPSNKEAEFVGRVNQLFESYAHVNVTFRNFCFGGAHSILQVALLKQSVIPWKPDIVVAELGTLDEFYASLSQPAVEAFFRIARRNGKAVVVLFPFTKYAPVARQALYKLGAAYDYPVLDMAAIAAGHQVSLNSITVDGCHPNDLGSALIQDAFAALIRTGADDRTSTAAGPPPRLYYRPNLFWTRLQPVLSNAGGINVRRYFGGAGTGVEVSSATVIDQPFTGSLIGVLFQLNGIPEKMSYKIDRDHWIDVPIEPAWFLNYIFRADLKPTFHLLQLRITPNAARPAVLEGFLVNDAVDHSLTQE